MTGPMPSGGTPMPLDYVAACRCGNTVFYEGNKVALIPNQIIGHAPQTAIAPMGMVCSKCHRKFLGNALAPWQIKAGHKFAEEKTESSIIVDKG